MDAKHRQALLLLLLGVKYVHVCTLESQKKSPTWNKRCKSDAAVQTVLPLQLFIIPPSSTANPEVSTLLRHAATEKSRHPLLLFECQRRKREGKTMLKFPAAPILTLLHADDEGCLSKQKQESPNIQRRIWKWQLRPLSVNWG